MTHKTRHTLNTLCNRLGLEIKPLSILQKSPFKFKVPNDFVEQMKPNDANDPLLKQILPITAETIISNSFSHDPVGDLTFNPTPSLIHKYHGRVLLIASPKCDIHCRYCFRRHFPYKEQISQRHLQKALDLIAADKSIYEVILSGGDPMSLTETELVKLIRKIEEIEHIKTLRIHSRTPVAAPSKAPVKAFLNWAQHSHLNKVLVIHCNHANELSGKTHTLFKQYRDAGFHLLNQSVLLKGVNDSVDTLEALSHKLFNQGVIPYYLNQLDQVQGATHFEVSHDQGCYLHLKLRERLSGYLLPQLVKDIINAPYKTPLY